MVVTAGSFPSGGLTASTNTVVMAKATENDTAVKFTWSGANFGKQLAVTYTVQLDVPSDTTGTAPWGNAKNFVAGNNITSFGFVTKVLNDLLNTMGVSPGVANPIAIRIKSDVNQYNSLASSIVPVYSNTVVLQVTAYSLSLYIPGAYQGWDPSKAPLLNPVKGHPGLYEAYENITGSGTQYFKFTNAPDWNHTNYGDGGNGFFSVDGNAGGLNVPDGGYYQLTADLNKNSWTATKTNWGVIGDASPGGWNNDTPMAYDAATQVWKVVVAMKKNGSFKFRANGAWAIDFGVDANGNIAYADNPLFTVPNLNNLSVAADGAYTITLDLHVSGVYNYSAIKNQPPCPPKEGSERIQIYNTLIIVQGTLR